VHEGVERFTSGDAKVSLEYFRPAAQGVFPAVFLLHGSGGLDPGTGYVFREIGRDLADQGYVVLIPHYFERTGHEVGQAFKDKEVKSLFESIQDAIDFAIANAPIDPDRIGVLGYSMGANAAYFCNSHNPRIKAIVAVSAWLPIESNAKFPPMLILLGSGDHNTPAARLKQFEAGLKERQVPYGSHVYRGIGHNFDIPTWDDASRRAATFFNKFLKAPKTKQSTLKGTPNTADAATASRNRGVAKTKTGELRTKTNDSAVTEASAKPNPATAQPKAAKLPPIDVDARPITSEAEPKTGGAQPKAGEALKKTGGSSRERGGKA
jgi:dienelactone hydrolase